MNINKTAREINCLIAENELFYHNIALKLGTSDSVSIILYALTMFKEGCTQKQISETFAISKQTINSSIKKLIKDGVIELKPLKAKNLGIFLTKKGETLVKEKSYPIFEIENNTMDSFSESEKKEFIRLLKKLNENTKEEIKKILG